MVDKICSKIVLQNIREADECDGLKQEVLVTKIEKYAASNKKCMKVIAECIETGECPISSGEGNTAWDPENEFRNLDNANKNIPAPKEPEPVDPEMLTPE